MVGERQKPVNVMLVDDHEVVLEGLIRILEKQGGIRIVSVARSAEEALEKLERTEGFKPDVIIVDIQLPGMNGIELIRRVKRDYPGIEAITLTVFDDEQFARQAIMAGAIGYVIKDAAKEELVKAVRAAAKGESLISTSVARKLIDEMTEPTLRRKKKEEGFEDLSQREVDVIKLMARGYNNRQIAEILFISEHTVKVHIRNIFRKIGVADRTNAVLWALDRGLVLKDKETIRPDKPAI
ncbi:MAG: response regulator transcription factor [Actinobacteria bacterium]|nr:response regulator transcription factor [Actinomycetota bacterium]MDI6832000.1 response regulator transcription factor [Actinomycetota bacterium]